MDGGNNFGTCMENLAARDEDLAPLLGLSWRSPDVTPPEDDGPA